MLVSGFCSSRSICKLLSILLPTSHLFLSSLALKCGFGFKEEQRHLQLITLYQVLSTLMTLIFHHLFHFKITLTLSPQLVRLRGRCQVTFLRPYPPQQHLQLRFPLQQDLPTPLVLALRVSQSFLQLRGVSPLRAHGSQRRPDPLVDCSLRVTLQLYQLRQNNIQV